MDKQMNKKNIDINKLENFLENAKIKINKEEEDIGEKNLNKLENFLSEIKNEKENLRSKKNIEDSIKKDKLEFEVSYKKDLLFQINNISELAPFDINFNKQNYEKN